LRIGDRKEERKRERERI